MKRNVELNGIKYTLTYDEYRYLDTVTVFGSDEPLSTKNRNVQKLANHADAIASFKAVPGVKYL